MISTMADAKKKPRGRPRGRAVSKVIQATVEPALFDALDVLSHSTRRTKNAELVLAIEAHLKAAGLWPPASPAGD